MAEQRIGYRPAAGGDPSDATPVVLAAMAGAFDSWPSASIVDTTGPHDGAVEQARVAAGPGS